MMSYNVAIERLSLAALFDLKGNQSELLELTQGLSISFPTSPNTLSKSGDSETCWIGPDHWLLRASLETETNISKALHKQALPDTLSVVQISDTLTFFKISGPDAHQIMSIASPLDTHPTTFPEQSVSYTEAFGIKALLVRRDQAFELAVDRSFGDMVEDCLRRAIG